MNTPATSASQGNNMTLSLNTPGPSTSQGSSTIISPEEFRGYPKAGPRKSNRRNKNAQSTIITDSPQTKKLKERHVEKLQRAQKKTPPAAKRQILRKLFLTKYFL